MSESVEREIRELRSLFWSDRDPEGRGFAPLADAYRRAGDFDQALELLNDGLDRHPEFATGHVVAGWVHRDRGADLEAEASFRTALMLDDENVHALRGLGFLLLGRGKTDEARSVFTRMADLEPGDGAVEAELAVMDDAAGVHEDAADAEPVDAAGGEDATAATEPLDPAGSDEDQPIDGVDADEEEPVTAAGAAWLMEEADDTTTLESALADLGLSSSEAPAAEADTGAEGEPAAEPAQAPPSAEDGGPVAFEPSWDEPPPSAEDAYTGEVEPASDVDADDEDQEGPYTRTMAELYARQGFNDRAARVYERLVAADPDNEDLRARLEELEARAGSEAPSPRDAGATAAAYQADTDLLAEEMSRGPEASDGFDSPFAWSDDVSEPRDAGDGRSVSAYFEALLAWTPGARSEADEPMDIAALAPEAGAAPPVEIGDLAPDEPIADPDGLPEGDTTVVPIESLAPANGGSDDGGRDGSDDEFDRWLNQL